MDTRMEQTSFWEMDDPPTDNALIKVLTQETYSKEAKNFQKKVRKIENLQKANEALKGRLEDIRQQLAKALAPISKEFCSLRVTSIENLDRHMQGTYFRANEKKKISILIVENAGELVGMFQDERGKPFHDKYSDMSFDDQEASLMEGMNSLFENIFGSVDHEDAEEPLPPPITPKNPRKTKTKAELHEETIRLESKTIYRNLMKTLHPDFEQDEDKKKEKTEVAQQISIAYQENNVYELLKLQSEHLNEAISEDDLKMYTTELNKRIRELEVERYAVKSQYKAIYDTVYSSSQGEIAKRIHHEQEKLEEHIHIERDHAKLFSDRKKLRRFLKENITLNPERPSDFEQSLVEAFFDDDPW